MQESERGSFIADMASGSTKLCFQVAQYMMHLTNWTLAHKGLSHSKFLTLRVNMV